MSEIRDKEKWAAAAAVFAEFRNCLDRGECDQLCRIATHTMSIYGKISKAAEEGDTPEKLNSRIRFVRGFRDGMHKVSRTWDAVVSRVLRSRKRPQVLVWICPRCSREDCAGAVALSHGMILIKSSNQ